MNVKKGDKVIFKGYEETPEDGADLLVEGNEYEVAEVNKEDGSVAVIVDNPDFNPKKKESESNARTILTDIFFEELELPKGSKAKPAAK
jgi:nanoRNase/pAp phosphatase (c-di-AMP/oligoRNAs hydrolase)